MPDPAGLDKYRQLFPQACSNFENDVALPADERDRFLLYLESYPGGDFQDYLQGFFHDSANKKLGIDLPLETGEVLGSARTLSSFASRFTTANGLDNDPVDAEGFIRDLTFLPADDLQKTLRKLFPPAAQITRLLMWSYRNPPNFRDPFCDIDLSDLICRLALPGYGLTEHIAFGHELAPTTFAPTCFDAGLMGEWRPGGRTRPMPDCENKYADGLPEVVHDPNVFHNIATALHLI